MYFLMTVALAVGFVMYHPIFGKVEEEMVCRRENLSFCPFTGLHELNGS